jgi:hypothetical protein
MLPLSATTTMASGVTSRKLLTTSKSIDSIIALGKADMGCCYSRPID